MTFIGWHWDQASFLPQTEKAFEGGAALWQVGTGGGDYEKRELGPVKNWRASQVALMVKNLPANAEDARDISSIPGLGRSPEGGYGTPLQYSCLENPTDRGIWPAMVHTVQRVEHDWSNLKWKWSCSVMSDSLRPHGLQPTRFHHPWDFPGKNTGVGYHSLLQEIFPTQGLNPGVPHCRQMLYHLSHQASP